jgi:hypothetical protein
LTDITTTLEPMFMKHNDNTDLKRDLFAVVEAVFNEVVYKTGGFLPLKQALSAKYGANPDIKADLKTVAQSTLEWLEEFVNEKLNKLKARS